MEYQNEKTIKINYRDNFLLLLAPMSQKDWESLRKKYRTWGYDKRTHQREAEVDTKRFYPAVVRRIVKGWEGLTERTKRIIFCGTKGNAAGAENTQEIPFDLSLAVEMLEYSSPFYDFVINCALNYEKIYEAEVEELEESEKKI